MRIVELTRETTQNILENMLKRSPNQYQGYEKTVNEIIADVKERGDEALFAYTEKFDRAALTAETVEVTEEEVREAYQQIDPKLLDVIKKALVNIRDYHAMQKQNSWFDSKENGTILGPESRRLCAGRQGGVSLLCADEYHAREGGRCRGDYHGNAV